MFHLYGAWTSRTRFHLVEESLSKRSAYASVIVGGTDGSIIIDRTLA